MDSVKPNPPALKQVVAHRPVGSCAEAGTEALGRMIAEALADFDPEFPSERRLKVSPLRPVVSLPRAWAKTAG